MLTYAMNLLKHLSGDHRGVTAVEYGLIASFIAVVIIVALKSTGSALSTTFNHIATSL